MSKSIPPKTRKEVFERDNGECQRCFGIGSQIHHIVNAGMGRRRNHAIENLITLCTNCHNISHTDKDVRNWCFEWSRERYGDKIDEIYFERKRG